MTSSKQKSPILGIVAKLALSLLLALWLVRSGKLDFSAFVLFGRSPGLIVMGIAVWVFSSILLQARRWKLLLSGLNVEIPQKLLNLYQMIGLMFNTAMPGAVGGDLVKALYIVDKQKNQTLAQSLAAVTMDRLLGMLIIMLLGMITAFIDVEHTFANPAILTLLLFTTSVFVGLCVFLASVLYWPEKSAFHPFEWLFKWPLLNKFRGYYLAIRAFRYARWAVIKALLITLVCQAIYFGFFWMICSVFGQSNISMQDLMLVYPIGAVITALPLAPGGLGVGHFAWQHLFSMVGATGGANVFNIYFLIQVPLNLLGIIPFIVLKKKKSEKVSKVD